MFDGFFRTSQLCHDNRIFLQSIAFWTHVCTRHFFGKYHAIFWTCNKSLSGQQREKNKKRERLVILGMLINIHELLGLPSIFKMTGSLSTVSPKLEWAIVKEHRAEPCSVVSLFFLSI